MSADLHLWVLPARGRSPREALETVLKPFLKARPGVSVRLWVVPWGTVWDRLMSVLKGRPGALAPDVLQIDPTWTGTLSALGLLGEVEAEEDGVLPDLWASCRWPSGRGLFAVPWTLDLRLPHVRASALERAGLSGADLAAWGGWDALLSRASRTHLGRDTAQWDGESLLAAFAPWVWSAGGDFLSPDGKSAAFLSPEALRAAAFCRSLFVEGPSAGVWMAPLGAPREKALSVFAPPQGPGGRFVHAGGGALAVAADTRHPIESRALLRHLAAAESQDAVTRALGLLSPRLADAERALDRPGRELLSEALSLARVPAASTHAGSFERLFQRHLAPLVRSAAPWDDWRAAMEGAAREAGRLLTAYRGPASPPAAFKKEKSRQLSLLDNNP